MIHPHLCIFIMSTFTALSHNPSFLPGNYGPLDTKQRWVNHYSVPRRNIIKAVSGKTIAYFRGGKKKKNKVSQSQPAVHVHALSKAHLLSWLHLVCSRIFPQVEFYYKRFFFLLYPVSPSFCCKCQCTTWRGRCSNNDNIMLVLVIIVHFMAHSLLLFFPFCNRIFLSILLTLALVRKRAFQ